jgi:hypothetical protein
MVDETFYDEIRHGCSSIIRVALTLLTAVSSDIPSSSTLTKLGWTALVRPRKYSHLGVASVSVIATDSDWTISYEAAFPGAKGRISGSRCKLTVRAVYKHLARMTTFIDFV